jgi:hypothetical protein
LFLAEECAIYILQLIGTVFTEHNPDPVQ